MYGREIHAILPIIFSISRLEIIWSTGEQAMAREQLIAVQYLQDRNFILVILSSAATRFVYIQERQSSRNIDFSDNDTLPREVHSCRSDEKDGSCHRFLHCRS
jgi:hypothetical protein